MGSSVHEIHGSYLISVFEALKPIFHENGVCPAFDIGFPE